MHFIPVTEVYPTGVTLQELNRKNTNNWISFCAEFNGFLEVQQHFVVKKEFWMDISYGWRKMNLITLAMKILLTYSMTPSSVTFLSSTPNAFRIVTSFWYVHTFKRGMRCPNMLRSQFLMLYFAWFRWKHYFLVLIIGKVLWRAVEYSSRVRGGGGLQ